MIRYLTLYHSEDTGGRSISQIVYCDSITLVTNPDKDTGKLEINTFHKHENRRCIKDTIIPNFVKSNPALWKMITHHDQAVFIQGTKSWFNIWKSLNISHLNRRKERNQMIISKTIKCYWEYWKRLKYIERCTIFMDCITLRSQAVTSSNVLQSKSATADFFLEINKLILKFM